MRLLRVFISLIVILLWKSVLYGQPQRFIQVSLNNPHYLEYSNGEPFIPIGPNICWERFEKDEVKVLQLYDQRFKKLSENGGNYTRIWLSAPFFEIEHIQAYSYDPSIVRRIDEILELAKKYNIKIKFCFENFRKLTGSPSPFPGSVPFDKPIYHVSNGGPINTMEEYFSTPKGKELFLEKMEFFSNKYAKNPNIYGWELWNEINAVTAPDSLLYDWTKEMLNEGHKYFPNHLVMQSLGGFETEKHAAIYQKYSLIGQNDLAQVHRYLNPGSTLEVCKGPMDILAADAVRQILSYKPDKPVILAEVGAVEANHAGPSKLYDQDTLGILLHDLLFAPFFSGAAAPGQSWHWQEYIEKNNLCWHFNRFAHAIKNINPIAEDYQPFYELYDEVRIYGLKGKTNTIIWCRNTRNNWTSELVKHQKPIARSVEIPLSVLRCDNNEIKISIYDPWNDTWTAISADIFLTIPKMERSIVLRIDHRIIK